MSIKKSKAYTKAILHRYGKLVSKGNGTNFYFYTNTGAVVDMFLFQGKYYRYVKGLLEMLRQNRSETNNVLFN